MKFYFSPADEQLFKQKANGNYVRTLVYDPVTESVIELFTRKVGKVWDQTLKNNVETDHRIKQLNKDHYHIYSWVIEDVKELGLPGF